MRFTELERDVLRWIVRTSDDEALVQQLMDAKPRRREFTGHGSFTDLRVPPHSPKAWQRVYSDGFPLVKSDELQSEAGCVLFCENGFAATLEFYMLGDGRFPQVLRAWDLIPWPKQTVRSGG